MPRGWQVGIDVGGTFTDVIAHHRARGEVRAAKVPSRTDDRIAGLLAALGAVDLTWADVDDLIHGTTIVTNAIVQGDHAKVALIATRGFSDTLAIGRQNRRHLYRLDLPPKLAPQVPAERRFEVTERLDHDGRVMTALDPASVADAIGRVEESGAEAVAVSLLHSYANPAHEEALGARLRERFPFVALSHRVNPEAREYERTATTALSAGVHAAGGGLSRRPGGGEAGDSRLHLFHSAGGMASPAGAPRPAARARGLGPCRRSRRGRPHGPGVGDRARHQLRHGRHHHRCLPDPGRRGADRERPLPRRPAAAPAHGGGGIHRRRRRLHRPARSRLAHGGAPRAPALSPGPACYAKGGDRPTVTDANLCARLHG